MTNYRKNLSQLKSGFFLTYTGMETDLKFTKGVDLPGFASYPLLETEEGTAILRRYYTDLIDVGKASGNGIILESTTWVASRDRGAALGYTPVQLRDLNIRAIELMSEVRDAAGDLTIILSANVGPRDDAYAPSKQMNAAEAAIYHAEQIAILAKTNVDLISGYTLAYPAEATGIVQAAKRFDLPVTIAFTLETNGRLPTGASLGDAIEEVDKATGNYASYFMINCAHPDHFSDVLTDAPWMRRVQGIVANASRCSHAELDEAEELDDGDPVELGKQLAKLRQRFPQINVLGGCCGTDMRHLTMIAEAQLS